MKSNSRTSNPWSRSGFQGGSAQYQTDIGWLRDPTSDLHTAWLETNTNQGFFVEGVVVSAHPGLNCYRVQLATIGLTVTCTLLSSGPMGRLSSRECCMLPVMSRVLVFMADRFSANGIIFGSLPSVSGDSNFNLPDFFVTLGLSGYRNEQIYNIPTLRDGATGLIDVNMGRPGDILPGDWAAHNELGVGMLVGKMMATIRGTDLSRLDLFYLDHLVRLYSHNFEHFGAGYERHLKDDEGEITDSEMFTLYPWEGVGLTDQGNATKNGSFEWQEGDTEAGIEPIDPQQVALWRLRRFRGYLGDLERLYVSAPNPGAESPVTMQSPTKDTAGLFEQILGLDGGYRVRSAKEIVLSKDILIPVPHRRKLDFDPTGDSPRAAGGSYIAAGKADGSHEKKAFPGAIEHPTSKAAQLEDAEAYEVHDRSVTAFQKHEKDFELPQPSEAVVGSLTGEDRSIPTDLSGRFQANLPDTTNLKVDHRDTDGTTYYKSKAFIGMLDDGSIVLQDGYGGEIKLSGGNIYLTCPGDVWMQPGRSIIGWAPKDFVLKAGNSVDISASKKDVRIKAEKNVHVLAGNAGTSGGILLESKAEAPVSDYSGKLGEDVISSGVVVKCLASNFEAHTQKTYIRSEAPGIILDASKGKAPILMSSRTIVATVQNQVLIACGTNLSDATKPSAVHKFGASFSSIDSRCRIGGTTNIAGSLFVNGSMAASGIAAASNAHLADVGDDFGIALGASEKKFNELESGIIETIEEQNDQLYEEDKGIGNDARIKEISFSCRTDGQYGYSGDSSFILYEASWQQRGRLEGKKMVWDEPDVVSGGGDKTKPHPGQRAWVDDANYRTIDPLFYDAEARRPKDRPQNVTASQVIEDVPLKDGYLITVAN